MCWVLTFTGSVTATSRSSSRLRYSIYSGDPNHHFAINSDTGKITVAKYLDADQQEDVMINIQVCRYYIHMCNFSASFVFYFGTDWSESQVFFDGTFPSSHHFVFACSFSLFTLLKVEVLLVVSNQSNVKLFAYPFSLICLLNLAVRLKRLT